MRGLALRLYHRLPASARSVVATAEGYYLRWWRYGPMSERLMQEAIERERWTAEQWSAWQGERLATILERAATRVPFYREQWAARRRQGDRASWELLLNWPVLEKETLRRQPKAFVADDCSPRRMFHLRTSGTTGTPLELWRSHESVRGVYGIGLARTRGWHGVSLRDRRAMLGGQLVAPVKQRRPPFWVWNAGLRQLYMSSYHLAPDLVPYYLDALVRYRVVYLVGYASSLHALAQCALRQGRTDLKMAVALTSAEPLYAEQRDTIAAAFGCPVRETYGMAENVAMATECPSGRLHLWPEIGIMEVVDEGRPVTPGGFGEFQCTGLMNPDMPLIRYRLADCGRLDPGAAPCACGRTLPMIANVEGRTTDLLLTRDGRPVFWVNPVLYGLPVRQAQIVQETLGRIVVRYVPGPEFSSEAGRTITARLRDRLGDIDVALEEVPEVPRAAGQKLRSVICNVSDAERELVLRQGSGRTIARSPIR
jgi:phenylacetate-CoA ligase